MKASRQWAEYVEVAEGRLPLRELRRRFPAQWVELIGELSQASKPDDADELAAVMRRVRGAADAHNVRVKKSGGNAAVVAAALPYVVKFQMLTLWLRYSYLQSMTEPDADSKVRLAFRDGFLMQRLFFRHGLVRKPVSMFWFKCLWPLTRAKQRALMLYLVQQKGIYCFYSRPLIERLAGMAGGRLCLEIAAGDGTLARFLRERGTNIRATDNHEWSHEIAYGAEVEKMDASRALKTCPAAMVLCSWPPAGNSFEAVVFQTPSVELYVVICSERQFASGNWEEYRRQANFSMTVDLELSALVLPPELEARVVVFRRERG